MTDGQPGTVGLENASDVEYLLSIPASVVAMADDGASLFHMMNGNTFTCGALRLTDAGKLDEAAKGNPGLYHGQAVDVRLSGQADRRFG